MEETRGSPSPAAEIRVAQYYDEDDAEEDVPPTLRRSGRARKVKARDLHMGDADSEDEITSSPTFQKYEARPRRNPKRKAAPEVFDLPVEMLAAALAPVRPEELQDWEGWIELESDPSFFNVILRDLGVKDVKIQELFSVDEGSLAILPQPVHGLIFLYQYIEEEEQPAADPVDGVWFANQTTSNACATVALLNIIMNAQGVELGDRLQEFKTATADLPPPLRGWLLCNNKWIRMIHNSFARRLDLLNADLALENSVDQAKKKARAASSKRSNKKKTKKVADDDAAYHFIAYVPVDGQVYQLDGLENEPLPIGSYTDDWTAVAQPFIETRMLQYESEQLSFNLLALCQSPLSSLHTSLSNTTRSLAQHDHPMTGGPSHSDGPHPAADGDCIVATSQSPPGGNHEQLQIEQAQLRAEYESELALVHEDEQRVAARREDYTLAIHTWVDMLASKGVLIELHEGTRGEA